MLSILNSHMYVLKYDDFSLPERDQKPFFSYLSHVGSASVNIVGFE